MADIGAGDGQLARFLWRSGEHPAVIATELRPGPLGRLRTAVEDTGIEVRVGAGLAPLAPGEVDVVVIAGMGGLRILEMLVEAAPVVARLRRLVLVPAQAAAELEAGLAAASCVLEEVRRVRQGGRDYTVLAARPAGPAGLARHPEATG